MTLFDLILIAVSLSMDAFAVSICKGLSVRRVSLTHALTCGLWFGGFQALMPALGYFLGDRFSALLTRFGPWIAFVLLALIGANMVKESFGGDEQLDDDYSAKAMLPLAIATSIDAFAVGVSFAAMQVNILPAAGLIGCITCLLSAIGVRVGALFGDKYRAPSERIGGIVLILIGLLLSMAASAKVNSTYARYDQVRNHAGITGAMAAEQILRMEGIYDVQVMRVSGKLTDHYDPANHVLRLSDSTYGSTSVAALGVAAHECGHAIQHARHYVPLTIRGALVPVANFGSGISWPLIIMGLFIRGEMSTLFINLGILMFSLAVLFQIITLPVEFNASGRALKILKNSGMLYESEVREARSVLTAAALTYVASAASALLQLLRILILTGGRRNDDE